MRYQTNRAGCGPAALGNALNSIGIHRGEEELVTLCRQTPDGTSPANLVRALLKLDRKPTQFREDNPAGVEMLLRYYLLQGRPLILCVDAWEHWVACTGLLGDRYAVVDSADNALLLYYSLDRLYRRWAHVGGNCHGIVV